MQQPVIPRVRAPSDLTQTSIAIVIGNQVYGVPAIELGSAFGFQPLDSDLTAIAALSTTSFGRSLLTLADAAAGRTAFALGTAATQNTGTSGANVPLLNAANTWSAIQTFSANPLVSGGAVSFPATQVPSAGANDLDDYEEGSLTPAFAATGATFSYTLQVGTYTKIGRMVFFDLTILLNTSGNTLTANALTITGLPFTAGAAGAGIFPVRWSASTTSYIAMTARVSGTTLILEGATAAATTNSTGVVANGALHATNGSTMRVIGNYIV